MLANVVNPTIPESPMLPLKWMAKSSPIHWHWRLLGMRSTFEWLINKPSLLAESCRNPQ
jgi:hypothetical protein